MSASRSNPVAEGLVAEVPTRSKNARGLKLNRDERKRVFDGTLKVLSRVDRPDQEAGDVVVVSWSKGGKQIVDRGTGKTVEIERRPRLWITVKGWHLRAGSTQWETAVTIHDQREQHRVLAGGIGGMPKEPGLRTRWGSTVVHRGGEIKVIDKRVPTREQQKEHWTPETERGYGGRDELEFCEFTGDMVPAAGVADEDLTKFATEAHDEAEQARKRHRRAMKQGTARLSIQERRDHATATSQGVNIEHAF